MRSTRTLVGLAACIVFLVSVAAVPATHAQLRRIAYAIGVLRPIPPLRTGATFPAFPVEALSGQRQELNGAAVRGTVIYNVFTSWCPSCRVEAPAFSQALPLLHKHGVTVVGIDQGEPAAAVARFTGDFGLEYPVVIDTDSATTTILSARVIPETIVVRNGIVQQIAVGPVTPAFLRQIAEGV